MFSSKSNLVYSYCRWLESEFTQSDVDGWLEITTPFLDCDNDCIQVYVKIESEKIILSDLSDTINHLKFSGKDISEVHFKRCLEITTSRFGIKCNVDYELYVRTTLDKFPQKFNDLVQCIVAVSNYLIFAR
jgi:hypothetical protein